MKSRLLIASAACAALAGCGGLLENEKSASQGATAPQAAKQGKAEQSQTSSAQVPTTAASERLIRRVQEQLQAKGLNAGPVDGIWGPETHEGLQQFQKQQGLQPSGQLNAATLSALGISEQEARDMSDARKPGQQQPGQQQQAKAGESASAGASRQDPPKFENLDANNDGQVSLAESAADTRISREFEKHDKDNSGGLTMEEFKAALKDPTEPAFPGRKY